MNIYDMSKFEVEAFAGNRVREAEKETGRDFSRLDWVEIANIIRDEHPKIADILTDCDHRWDELMGYI